MNETYRREFVPTEALRQDIQCFWILEEPQDVYNCHEIIPDPYVELVINCGAPLVQHWSDGSRLELPDVFINGLQNQPLCLEVLGRCQFVAARMHPWALNHFLDSDSTTVSGPEGSIIMPGKAWDGAAFAVRWTAAHHGYEQAVHCFQDYMISRARRSIPAHTPIYRVAEKILTAQGQLRIDDLAAQCYLSPSQLERRFKQITRITPKMYARLVRFRAVCYRLIANPDVSTLQVAQDLGFTDQAHLIRDFKGLAQQTPGAFAANAKSVSARYGWRHLSNLSVVREKLG